MQICSKHDQLENEWVALGTYLYGFRYKPVWWLV